MALTILTKVTLHIKDEKKSIAPKFDTNGVMVREGRLVVIEVPPNTAVAFEDEGEALDIVDRHGGEETDLPPRIKVPARAVDALSETIIPLSEVEPASEPAEPKAKKAA